MAETDGNKWLGCLVCDEPVQVRLPTECEIAQWICGCYAGCTAKPLDVINLYARLNDLSNSDAIRVLARMVV